MAEGYGSGGKVGESVEGMEMGTVGQETKTQRILSQTEARKLELKLKAAWETRGKRRARISRKMR